MTRTKFDILRTYLIEMEEKRNDEMEEDEL